MKLFGTDQAAVEFGPCSVVPAAPFRDEPADVTLPLRWLGRGPSADVDVDVFVDRCESDALVARVTGLPLTPMGTVPVHAAWSPARHGARTLYFVVTTSGCERPLAIHAVPIEVRRRLILVDGGHDSWYVRTGKLEAFLRELRRQGYETIVAPAGSPLVDRLAATSVLVVAEPERAYDDADVAAIADFVRRGGGLVVTSSARHAAMAANPLLGALGSPVTVGTVAIPSDGHPVALVDESFASSRPAEPVAALLPGATAIEISSEAAVTTVARCGDQAVSAVWRLGKGRMAVVGGTPFTNRVYVEGGPTRHDAPRANGRLVDWLSGRTATTLGAAVASERRRRFR